MAVRVRDVDDAFVLEVVNDGVGPVRRAAGMGLRLAALEALQSGGVVEFGEREPGTWQVRLVVPHDEEDGVAAERHRADPSRWLTASAAPSGSRFWSSTTTTSCTGAFA